MKIYNKSRRCVVNTFINLFTLHYSCAVLYSKSSKSINYTLETK